MMALEEFNECEQRFTFLTRERDDLLQSIADTQQAIVELDQATKEKFELAFHSINKNFSEAFHTIFGGGMAEMRLTEPDSSGDAGNRHRRLAAGQAPAKCSLALRAARKP